MPSAKMSRTPVVITIDGPAGAGKSTIAKKVAQSLGYTYLDTGSMYRALTLKALHQKVNLEDEQALVDLVKTAEIDIQTDEQHLLRVLLDGQEVSEEIRTLEVTNNTFYIARVPDVREVMVEKQRSIGARTSVVVEGRDTGTVVFPWARKKFYLDASLEERAKRRILELKEKGKTFDENALKAEIHERDLSDMNRKVGPLKAAEDAIKIDTTDLDIEQVAQKILDYIKRA